MKHLLAAMIVLIASSVCQAQPPLTITKNGYYLTILTDGEPTYVKLTHIIDLTDGVTPTPPPTDPGPDPDPPTVDPVLVEKIKQWSLELNDPDGAQALAIVYKTVEIGGSDSPWPTIREASEKALELVGAKGDWVTFRAKVSEVLTEEAQKGVLDTEEVVKSVQHGLELSADGSPALTLDIITQIITLTQEIGKNEQ